MKPFRQYVDLVRMSLLSMRALFAFITMVQVVLTLGLVLGVGYYIPDISEQSALFITTGTATNVIVSAGLVALPQQMSVAKAAGSLDYMLTLPISREAYVFAQITIVALMSLPAVVGALALGVWHYNLSLDVSPLAALVFLVAVVSLAGVGVAMAVISPRAQLTNAITQLMVFYVLFFAPVLVPKEQLPSLLRHTADFLPPAYVADAVRASLTDLPGTHLGRSLIVMAGFAVVSVSLSAAAIRRRA